MGSKTVDENPKRDDKHIKKKSNVIKKRALPKKKYITKLEKTLHRSHSLSFMSKKSLCHNNRALAKCLSQQKRETRDLTSEVNYLVGERFELSQQIIRLKAEKQRAKVDLEKFAKFKKIKNQITGNVLEFVRLINSLDDLSKDQTTDSQKAAQIEEIENQNDVEQRDEIDQNGLIINLPTAEKIGEQFISDDAALSKNNGTLPARSPIDGPKAVFDLTAISEQSEIESRRTSIQRRSSLANYRRTRSAGARESTIRHRSRGSNVRLSCNLKMTSPCHDDELGEKQPVVVLTDIYQKEDRISLHKQRTDEMIELNRSFISPIRLSKCSGSKDATGNNAGSRRATFTVTESLQTAAWPPVDPPSDTFVSVRKSKPSSTSMGSAVDPGKASTQPAEPLNKPNEALSKPNEQQPIEKEVTDLELKDMDMTEVDRLPIVVLKNIEEKTGKTVKIAKATDEKKDKRRSKEENQPPFLVLSDVVRRSTIENGRRESKAKNSLTRNSIPANDGCYNCNNLEEESIIALGNYKTWRNRMSAETREEERVAESESPPTEKPVKKALETIDTKKSKKRISKTKKVEKKTPKKHKSSCELKKGRGEFQNSPKSEIDSTDKENEDSDRPRQAGKIMDYKENEASDRPRRARKKIDYKLPSLITKIRRDEGGNVLLNARPKRVKT